MSSQRERPGEGRRPDARAYEELRRHAELLTGRTARSRRIFSLSCRRGGADCETSVGAHNAAGGEIVEAIFDVGDAYVIVWCGGHEIMSKRRTYLAVDFD